MLTGESMPVQKFLISERNSDIRPREGKQEIHVIRRYPLLSSGRNEEILAIVQTASAQYNEHLKVLIALLLIYAVIAGSLVISFLLSNGKLSNRYAVFCYAIFLLVCVISPLLPVVITVGQGNASQRLVKQGVFSLNVQRITHPLWKGAYHLL